MNPAIALQSDVFRIFATGIGGLIIGAGGLLAALRFGLGRNVEAAWNSYRGWLLMAPVALGVIFLGRTALIIGLTALAAGAFIEFARATMLDRETPIIRAALAAITATGATLLIADPVTGQPGWSGAHGMRRSCSCNCSQSSRNAPAGTLQATGSAGCSALQAAPLAHITRARVMVARRRRARWPQR